jgi:flagellar motor switch protein FliG
MAEIFNNFDRANEGKFMQLLEEHSKDAADRIKKLMFTFDDMLRIDSAGLQTILKAVDKSKLAVALKGASQEVRTKFMEGMSQRAAKILQEEIEALGPVRLKDVDESQSEIIVIAKDLINKGDVEIIDPSESDQLVY